MNPSSSGPVYTIDSEYFGNRVLFYTNRFPVHTKHRIRPPQAQPGLAQLHDSGILGGILDIKKAELENLGNCREKNRPIREFQSNLNIHPTFWQYFTSKTLTKRFLLCSYRREGLVCLNATLQCLEHCLLSTTNQRLIIRVVYATAYQRLLTKRPKFFEKFWKFQGVCGEFQTFLNEFQTFIREFPERILGHILGIIQLSLAHLNRIFFKSLSTVDLFPRRICEFLQTIKTRYFGIQRGQNLRSGLKGAIANSKYIADNNLLLSLFAGTFFQSCCLH